MNEYQSRIKSLSQRLKDTPPETKKLQEVKPLEAPTEKEPERQLMCWIPQSLMYRLRIKVAKEECTQKEIIIRLLEEHLKEEG